MIRAMNPVIKELATELQQPPYAVRKWKLRGKVPHKHRIAMLQLAAAHGMQLEAGDFDFGTVKRKPRRRKVAA